MNLVQISSSLIFITTIAALTSEEYFQLNDSSIPNHNRLSLNVHPVGYDIKLYLMFEKNCLYPQPSIIKQHDGGFPFYGESNITIQIRNLTQNIKLHASNLAINHCYITLTDLIRDRLYTVEKFTHNSGTDFLDLRFFDILLSGPYILNIKFQGWVTDNNAKSFVSSSYINREEDRTLLIAPHIQEVGARRLFPCWDEPYLKTTFNISIKHHYDFIALSNMPIRDHYGDGDGLMTHFHTTPPMSPYQVLVILTNFSHTRIHKHTNDSLWYAKRSGLQSLKYAMRVIEKITLHLESEFNDTKIPEIDHIVIPNYPHNADMSKLGFVFHREADLICDDKLDPIMRKIEIARSIASKIAYQWLGNVISPSWWSHFWLHEGLSILFGEEAVVKALNNSQIMDLFIVQSQYDSLGLGSHFAMNPPLINSLSQIDLIFSFPRYVKGIVVLRMLQNTVTDEVFRNGVRTCLKKYKFRSLTFNKFWSIQEELANRSKYDISDNFLKWLKYEWYPVIRWTQEEPLSGELTQYFGVYDRYVYGDWWILITLVTKFSLKSPEKVWLTHKKPSLPVSHTAKDWIMVDIRQAGYYRVKYDMENLRKLALYLNSGAYKDISVINRAKIIDDAFHFLLWFHVTREINSTVFWELAKYLTRETDYVAWYPMLKVFEYISSVLPLSIDEINFIHIKETMREILAKPLKVLGFEERLLENDFTKCLRQEIVKWACTVELSECLQKAKFKLEQHINDTKAIKVLPEWKHWTYCEGFKGLVGGSTPMEPRLLTWPELTRDGKLILWPGIDGNKYVEYITCFKEDNAISQIFMILQHKNSKLGRQHGVQEGDIKMCISIFHSLIARHAKNEVMLKKIIKSFHHIKPPEISTAAALINIVNHIYNTTLLNKLSIDLKYQYSIDLEQIASEVYSKIKTRISEIEGQIHHLDMLL